MEKTHCLLAFFMSFQLFCFIWLMWQMAEATSPRVTSTLKVTNISTFRQPQSIRECIRMCAAHVCAHLCTFVRLVHDGPTVRENHVSICSLLWFKVWFEWVKVFDSWTSTSWTNETIKNTILPKRTTNTRGIFSARGRSPYYTYTGRLCEKGSRPLMIPSPASHYFCSSMWQTWTAPLLRVHSCPCLPECAPISATVTRLIRTC